jgi:RNA polymerase sigma factor (sigma-70 family)
VLADQRRAEARRSSLRERLRREVVGEALLELPDRGLMDALRCLSLVDREVLLLRYWEEFEPAQIAAAVGCSRATVAVRLHRARLRLRKALDAGREEMHVKDDQHEQSCVTRTEPV